MFRSDRTFKAEYESLRSIPGIFWPSPSDYEQIERPFRSILEQMPDWLLERRLNVAEEVVENPNIPGTETKIVGSGASARRIYEAATKSVQTLQEVLLEETGIDLAKAMNDAGDAVLEAGRLTLDFGTEALGTYVPWHAAAESQITPWGMYFFLDAMIGWSIVLYLEARLPDPRPSLLEVFRIVFIITYRHESFHYHVERFSTKQEIVQRLPIYRPYVDRLRKNVAGTERWLEEALAQAVVLESTFVERQLKLKNAQLRALLEPEFRKFPNGYRHFDCKDYGGLRVRIVFSALR